MPPSPLPHTNTEIVSTVEIALWSNIETGLGITAGSMATLRPLLRHWFGSNADYSSGMPGVSGSRSRRPPGASRDRPFPLGSLDEHAQNRLRPDKLAVTVTTVQSTQNETTWRGSSSPSSSEERLTFERPPPMPSLESGEMGLSIHRTFEVTSSAGPGTGTSESIREHV